jgi:hypothetical protein
MTKTERERRNWHNQQMQPPDPQPDPYDEGVDAALARSRGESLCAPVCPYDRRDDFDNWQEWHRGLRDGWTRKGSSCSQQPIATGEPSLEAVRDWAAAVFGGLHRALDNFEREVADLKRESDRLRHYNAAGGSADEPHTPAD